MSSSSRCIDLLLRNIQCQGSSPTRHGLLIARAAFSTSSRKCTTSGPAYVQKPDKTHPVPTDSVRPSAASQVFLHRKSKQANILNKRGAKERMEDLELEERLQAMDKLAAMERIAPFDIWAQPVELFDLHIPRWTSPRKDASITDHLKALWNTGLNWFKNANNMRSLAQENSFPGIQLKSPLSLQIFKVQSTPWLAPFREIALKTYKDVYTALAAGDAKTLKKLTGVKYEKHLMKLLHARDPSRVYVWNLVKEETPCKVVSIRANMVHLGATPPKFGNRLLIQALVKFDTLQTLQVYNKRGALIGGDEKPRRVVQYLVFQKRMWYDTPWIIRDEIFESLEAQYKQL